MESNSNLWSRVQGPGLGFFSSNKLFPIISGKPLETTAKPARDYNGADVFFRISGDFFSPHLRKDLFHANNR